MPYRYLLIRGERGASMCLVMLLCPELFCLRLAWRPGTGHGSSTGDDTRWIHANGPTPALQPETARRVAEPTAAVAVLVGAGRGAGGGRGPLVPGHGARGRGG